MNRLILFTILAFICSIAYLLGYYSKPSTVATTNKNFYSLPILPNQPGVASTNVIYTIDGILTSINSDKSSLSIQTSDGKIFGPYNLDPNTEIQQKLNKLPPTKVNRQILKNNLNITINYVYKWNYDYIGSYISSIEIK